MQSSFSHFPTVWLVYQQEHPVCWLWLYSNIGSHLVGLIRTNDYFTLFGNGQGAWGLQELLYLFHEQKPTGMVSLITSSKHHPASRETLQSRVWTTPQSAVVPSDLGCGFLCINWLLLASLNPFISFVIGQKKKDVIVNLYGSLWLQVFGVTGFCYIPFHTESILSHTDLRGGVYYDIL